MYSTNYMSNMLTFSFHCQQKCLTRYNLTALMLLLPWRQNVSLVKMTLIVTGPWRGVEDHSWSRFGPQGDTLYYTYVTELEDHFFIIYFNLLLYPFSKLITFHYIATLSIKQMSCNLNVFHWSTDKVVELMCT